MPGLQESTKVGNRTVGSNTRRISKGKNESSKRSIDENDESNMEPVHPSIEKDINRTQVEEVLE